MRVHAAVSQSRFALLLCLFLLNLLAAPAIGAPAVPKGIQQVAELEGITEYRLDNGLKVLLFPDHSKPTVTVNITYLVGSRHENYGETGMAHLLEHLVFKGTPTHTEIPKEFKQRGARFNGTTWLDRTNYYEILPAGDDNLRWAIALEADRMVNSFIAKKDLDSEMTVVRNELEMGENRPGSVLLKRMQSIAYDWHSYGRATIGNRSDVENVRIENLQAFYRTYYQPDNAVLLIAGKFDPALALAEIAKTFGKIAKPTRKLPPEWTVEPTQDGERSFVVRRQDDVQIVQVAYKIPSRLHTDNLALALGMRVLTDAPTGRLHKSLVETGKAAHVFSFNLSGMAPGLGIFGAQVKPGESLEAVRDALVAQIESFADQPPTETELARVKTVVLNGLDTVINNHERLGVALSESIALGDWRLFFVGRDLVPKITSEQIASAAKRYLLRDNRIVGLYLPETAAPRRAAVPPSPTAGEILRDYKPTRTASTAEAFDPSTVNIDARTERTTIGGLKVALLPKKNRGETVVVGLTLNIGNEQSLFGKSAVSQLTSGMIGRGTTRMTRDELSDAADRLKMTGGFHGFQTTRANLNEALALAAHAIREPSFPESEFIQLKKQILTGLEARRKDPQAVAQMAMGRHFNRYPKGDPRYYATLDEEIADINAVTLDDVKEFHRQNYGAGSGQLAIVGDFDAAAVKPVLARLYQDWRAPVPFREVLDRYFDIPAQAFQLPTPDKENAVYIARLNVDMRDDSPDYPALLVASHILGGASLSSRLADRVRQKDGLSYGIGASLHIDALDNAGDWMVRAIASPKNAPRVDQAVREEIARARKDGFTPREVADAVANLLQSNLQTRAQDGGLVGIWQRYLYLDRTFTSRMEKLERQIKLVTVESANAALRKYIVPEKMSSAIAADPQKM